MKKAQQLFAQFVEDERSNEIIRAFMSKKKETYDKDLKKMRHDINDIIKAV